MSQTPLAQVGAKTLIRFLHFFLFFLFAFLANVDASVMYRRWKESKEKDEEYKTIIMRQVKKSQEEAKKDNVTSK